MTRRSGLPRLIVTLGIAATALAGCGGSGGESAPPPTRRAEDLEMTAADFRSLHTMTKVGNYFVANDLGHLDEALAVARSKNGGTFPVGTVIQLVPQEAMVKRQPGWNPKTRDWEFFFLDVSETGTTIVNRGADDVVNRFGGNCASCHLLADRKWDLICQDDHGCEPLPVDDAVIAAIQQADPRPR